MIEKPLVSVLMTAYNREKYIAEAIESVMASSYQNWELIIVDDRSKDATLEIANSYAQKEARIKVYVNEINLGDYPNRNKAASYAKGKYLKYLDSDDTIYPHGLEVMVDAMEKFPEASCGFPYNKYESVQPFPFVMLPREALLCHFSGTNFLGYGPSATIYNSEIFKLNNGYENKGVASDFNFHLKISSKHPVVLFQRDLIWWRIHDNQQFNEFRSDYINLNHQIVTDFTKTIPNPLSLIECRQIADNQNRNNFRKAILYLIKGNFRRFLMIIKVVDINFLSVINVFKKAKPLKI